MIERVCRTRGEACGLGEQEIELAIEDASARMLLRLSRLEPQPQVHASAAEIAVACVERAWPLQRSTPRLTARTPQLRLINGLDEAIETGQGPPERLGALVSAADEAFERAFWQALEDMKAGAEKPIESYLRLVPSGQRDELGRMLADVLAARGPTPAAGAAESEGYRRAVAVVDEVLGARGGAGILPGTLKAMRNARGIEPDAVVERLAGGLRACTAKKAAGLWPATTTASRPASCSARS